ncbi:MAG: chemotaxis protein CheC [Actinomycetota bacterium]
MTTSAEHDILTEVTNVGGGNAATAMSELLMTQVHMGLPQTVTISAEDYAASRGAEHGDIATTLVGVTGQIDGQLLLLYGATEVYESTLGVSGPDLDSAFAEIGNILCARFLIAIGELADIFAEVTPPTVHHVDTAALAALVASNVSEQPFTGLVTKLRIDGIEAAAELVYLPTPTALGLLRAIL